MPATRLPDPPLKPVPLSEAGTLRAMVMAAIDEAFGQFPGLAAREKARYDIGYLRALLAADPCYGLFAVAPDGQVAGFLLSQPDQGALTLLWCYLKPSHRHGTYAMSSMTSYIRHWDNGRFHKIVAYTTPANTVVRLLMKRAHYRETALLEKHIYGQDFLLCERMLTKVSEGYDAPVVIGFIGRLRLKLRSVLSHG